MKTMISVGVKWSSTSLLIRQTIRLTLAALVLGCLATEAQIVTNRQNPLADSYVRSDSVNNNFGSFTNVLVRTNTVAGTATCFGFYKFGLTGVSNVGTASLRVYGPFQYTGSVVIAVYSVADTNWTESGITWANKPPGSNLLSSLTINLPTTSANWYEFSVGDFINGEVLAGRKFATLSLVETAILTGNTANYGQFVSKEFSVNKPELAWTTNSPPTVSITSPANNAVVLGATTISASASDVDGTITKVDFYANGSLIATDLSTPYSTTWSSVVLGAHSFTAKATDNRGLEVTSSAITVTNTHTLVDANTNGISDILEDISLASSAQFVDTPFIVTGTIEAEQFDKGGDGAGYHTSVDHANALYRKTRASIEWCSDTATGYAVTKLRQGDWLKYSFRVMKAGYYTIEPRVSAGVTGGTFKVEFANANSTAGYQTPAITVAQSNWHSLSYGGIYLAAGSNSFKLLMNSTNSSGDSYVGKFNYISIYPTVNPNVHPTYTNIVSGLYTNTGTNFLLAQLNSSNIQHAVETVLAAGGGVVKLPAGEISLAQHPVHCADASKWEMPGNSAGMSFAVRVVKLQTTNSIGSNIKIAGDPAGGTTLQAQNRSVCLFYVGDGFWGGQYCSFTNISFANLTFQGAPHTRTNGIYEPGWFTTDNTNGGGYIGVGSHLVIHGTPTYPTLGVDILNCTFKNTSRPVVVQDVENFLLRSNSFLFFTGHFPHGMAVSNVLVADGVTHNSSTPNCRPNVGVLGPWSLGSYGVNNMVATENYFDGSVSGDGSFSTNGLPGDYADFTDGLIWIQGGGNWFVARNIIDNYVLEGVQYNGGPGAVVGNVFATHQYSMSTTALNLTEDLATRGITQTEDDLNYSFIGNVVTGGRSAVLGAYYASDWNDPFYDAHVCGNDVTIDSPSSLMAAWFGDMHGAAAWLGNCGRLNMAGNTIYGDGAAYYGWYRSKLAEIHFNTFTYATTNAISFDGPGSNVVKIVISQNPIGQGNGVHLNATNEYWNLSVPATNFFLIKDTFYDANLDIVVQPVTKPASYPVYIQY